MGAGRPEWLVDMTDDELKVIARELEARAEQFSPETRLLVNDELRRRKMPVLGTGVSRF